MKILGYIVGNQTIGTDLLSWTDTDLNGNEAFLFIEDNDAVISGYEDISSIITWGKFGDTKNILHYHDVRKEIQKLLTDDQLTGGTSGLTAQEIQTIQDYQLDEYYLVYDYYHELPDDTDYKKPPLNLDYDILGMHKKRTFDKGELTDVDYYKNYDFVTDAYDTLVLHEDRTYYRINEMVYKRELNICWHYNTGVSGATKTTEKFYTQQESLRTGERRRRNCITNLKIEAVYFIMNASGVTQQEAEQIGWLFLEDYSNEIAVYIEGVETPLMTALMTDTTHGWLDWEIPNTGGIIVRQYLYNGIDINYNVNNTYIPPQT